MNSGKYKPQICSSQQGHFTYVMIILVIANYQPL